MNNRTKSVQQFTAVFEEDEEVGGYTVTIPALPGCISEGDTFEEASVNIQEAASLYLKNESKKRTKKAPFHRVILAGVSVAA